MSTEVRVPVLPESIADATILVWHKSPGDMVQRDENLLDLETDKVVLEVPSPVDGIMAEPQFKEGDVVTTDQVLVTIKDAEAGEWTGSNVKPESSAEVKDESAMATTSADEFLTPSVRSLVKEMGLNPADITGTGKDGRITKADVMKHLDAQEESKPESQAVAEQSDNQDDVQNGHRTEQRVPMSRLRKRIAERLVEVQQQSAILTTFNEVDLQRVMEMRDKYRNQFETEHDVRLGFMSFFVKAVIEGLKKYPAVNASIDGGDILYHGYFDIGIAVSSPRGLVVPILRDADQMSFAEIETGIKDYGLKAREGTLTYEEMTGGTFSITNGGVFGSMLSTPILNPPQSAILGMHSIQQRPMVVDGEIVIRPMMYLALSYDHRIIDGREAVSFLVTVKESLQDPARLLLQI